MSPANDDFSHLDGAGRAVAAVARHPRGPVVAVLALAALLAWSVLAAMAIRLAEASPAAMPGDTLLRLLPPLPVPAWFGRFAALCLGPVPPGVGAIQQAGALVLMWFLMAVATMLPSALPMVRTYCEIADTARAKGEAVVHPLVLVAGYLATWLAASAAFATLTFCIRGTAGQGQLAPAMGWSGAAALAIAGLYQFSAMKEACLTRCRNPFATLFANWSARSTRIFVLGLKQGAWCLGCCWALMLVMFAVGLMNLLWMTLIAALGIAEKQVSGRGLSRVAGTILLVWSAALLVVSV